jgi:hypothetical protein
MSNRFFALLAVALLAACTDVGPPMNGGRESDAGKAPERPDVAAAREDLAQRLNIDPGGIEFVEHRFVTWSDGSMGCPEPGMFYTQAMVDGIWIHFRVAGKDHVYHGRRSGDPFYCPADRAGPPPDGDGLS